MFNTTQHYTQSKLIDPSNSLNLFLWADVVVATIYISIAQF